MCDKMAISPHILIIVENDPFLRLQMAGKEIFIKIKLMQNETNLWSSFW